MATGPKKSQAVALGRLWQPRHPLFWLLVMFNVLSSLCAWLMRTLPLSDGALLGLGALALANVGFGLWAAWRLVSQAPTSS